LGIIFLQIEGNQTTLGNLINDGFLHKYKDNAVPSYKTVFNLFLRIFEH
jgi:hypothetical protein